MPVQVKLTRYQFVFSAFLLGAATLAAHLFLLEFWQVNSTHYLAQVKASWYSWETPQGKRGNLYYRDGSLLAGNRKVAQVVADPSLITDMPAVGNLLSQLTGKPEDEIKTQINATKTRFIAVADGVPISTARQLDGFALGGVFTRYYYERYYPQGEIGAPATVGYAGRNPLYHRLGLEYAWDAELTGVNGYQPYCKDKNRNRLPVKTSAKGRPAFALTPAEQQSAEPRPQRDGEAITTTLHPAVQLICEDELRKALAKNRAEWACIVVMDPRNGQVLGAATAPAFDPNEYVHGNVGNERNYLVHWPLEPGSTVKPLLVAYAVQKGWFDLNRHYRCDRPLKYGEDTVREADVNHVVGDAKGVTLDRIIIESSNIGMSQVAHKTLQQQKVMECYSGMGFFSRTGIELPGEEPGSEPEHEATRKHKGHYEWPDISLANAGFGQGFMVTPLQLAAAYCIVANGGYRVQPTLRLSPAPVPLLDGQAEGAPKLKLALPEGEELLSSIGAAAPSEMLKPLSGVAHAAKLPSAGLLTGAAASAETRERVLSQATCDLLKRWLAAVITDPRGTGHLAKLRLEQYQAAGKTGTAQVGKPGHKGYLKNVYTSSFAGFFPLDEPRYVVLVMFGHPRGGEYYGGLVAAPVFKAIGDRLSYLDQIGLVQEQVRLTASGAAKAGGGDAR